MDSAHAGETGETGFATSPKLGLWWFLASEIMMFGGVVASYFLLRLAGPGWGSEVAHNNVLLGSINTIVLLSSSFTMVEVHAAWRRRDAEAFRRFLGITIALGLAFLVIKGFEYGAHFRDGIFPAQSLFWSFYYGMTGLHALHVVAGIIANVSLLIVAWRPEGLARFGHRAEMNGLYWHFVDVVWIILFPLLYLG